MFASTCFGSRLIHFKDGVWCKVTSQEHVSQIGNNSWTKSVVLNLNLNSFKVDSLLSTTILQMFRTSPSHTKEYCTPSIIRSNHLVCNQRNQIKHFIFTYHTQYCLQFHAFVYLEKRCLRWVLYVVQIELLCSFVHYPSILINEES